MKLPLQPDPGVQFEHAYISSSRGLAIGATVTHNGAPWQVTWCQPKRGGIGFLCMIVPRKAVKR